MENPTNEPAASERPLPDGEKYLYHLEQMESQCERATREWLAQAGDKAPQTRSTLLDTLAALDGAASCYWGCDRKDHTIRYMLGRCCGAAVASIRLLELGYYDESIGLSRSVGEIANLLFLFGKDPSVFEDWKNSDKKRRLREFSPYQVRLRLEGIGVPLPMSAERYSLMSETATHVTPQTLPQAYNPKGVPTLGGYFQPVGALACLNELGYIVALVGLIATKLVDLPNSVQTALLSSAERLFESVGSVDLSTVCAMWESIANPVPDSPAT